MTADAALSPPRARSAAGRTARGAALVSVALLAVNGLSYVFTVLAARTLVPQAYGELAALLGVLLIGAVPGTGLQTAAALRLAGAADRGLAGLHGAALATSAAVTLVGVLAAGPVMALLHLPGPAPVCWLVVVLFPQTLVGGYTGLLQGTGRYVRLALVTAVFGLAKAGGGTAGLLLGGTSAAALAGMATGSLLAALLAWALCGRPAVGRDVGAPVRATLRASGALLGLVVLVNLDLLLARHHLPPAQAGEYAVGAVFAKVAFWLPQGIAVVVLPALGDPRTRARALPVALALVGGSGAVLTAGTARIGRASCRERV